MERIIVLVNPRRIAILTTLLVLAAGTMTGCIVHSPAAGARDQAMRGLARAAYGARDQLNPYLESLLTDPDSVSTSRPGDRPAPGPPLNIFLNGDPGPGAAAPWAWSLYSLSESSGQVRASLWLEAEGSAGGGITDVTERLYGCIITTGTLSTPMNNWSTQDVQCPDWLRQLRAAQSSTPATETSVSDAVKRYEDHDEN